MIVFSPKNGEVKHTVTIFTDIDCGYCRQFHREIDKVNALGIEVHYLFFPRTGRKTESWRRPTTSGAPTTTTRRSRARSSAAKSRRRAARHTPVEAHFTLGQRVGVRGTPAVFAENGELLGGYLPPATLPNVSKKSQPPLRIGSASLPRHGVDRSPEAWVALTTLTFSRSSSASTTSSSSASSSARLPEAQRQRRACLAWASRWARGFCCCC